MPSGFQNWSQTAASNATADSAINWAAGATGILIVEEYY